MSVRCRGAQLAATLAHPGDRCRAAVVLLHPADDPSRRQFLFEHLAIVLPERGIAVFRYDRRVCPPGRDVPYGLQAEDLAWGLEALAGEVGSVPTGLWGFSQGAWVALLAAAGRADIAFLVLVGCSALSPARQMQYGTAEQLRRAGFGLESVAELGELRTAWEAYQRGQLARQRAQQVVDTYAGLALAGCRASFRRNPAGTTWTSTRRRALTRSAARSWRSTARMNGSRCRRASASGGPSIPTLLG